MIRNALIITLAIVSVAHGQPNDLRFAKIEKNIRFSDERIVTNCHERGQADKTVYFSAYYGETEEIEDIGAKIYFGNKTKKIKSADFLTSTVGTNSFYDGQRKQFYNASAPEPFTFDFQYTKVDRETFFAPSLILNSPWPTDTFLYHITVPEGARLLYHVVGDTSLISLKTSWEDHTLTVLAIPEEKITKGSTSSYVDDTPVMLLSVIPDSLSQEPYHYLNHRYRNLISAQSVLESSTVSVIKESIPALPSARDSIFALFDLIRNQITYIDIENGTNAYIPRNVNEVYQNKYGDCKDMANLLTQLLQHFGFEAHVALSASSDSRADLDFPCYGAANHVICVAEINGRLLYLDPTDALSPVGLPSTHIQSKHIYIIDENGGRLHFVEPVTPLENQAKFHHNITLRNDSLLIAFRFDFKGHSSNFLKYLDEKSSVNDREEIISIYLSKVFAQKVSDYNVEKTTEQMTITGEVAYPTQVTKVGDFAYIHGLPAGFIPSIPSGMDLNEYRYIARQTFRIEHYYAFTGNSIIHRESTERDGNGIIFKQELSEREGQPCVTMVMESPYILYDRDKMLAYNLIHSQYQKELHKPIKVEKAP